jgi:hypothetical protein
VTLELLLFTGANVRGSLNASIRFDRGVSAGDRACVFEPPWTEVRSVSVISKASCSCL